MDDIIKLKCPLDGIVLTIKNEPGIEKRVLTCPVCKRKYPFSQFRMDAQKPAPAAGPSAESAGGAKPTGGVCLHDADDNTDLVSVNFTLGKVVIPGTVIAYQLMPGRTIIGRKSASSTANFQIDTAGKKGMSREHLLIEVTKEPGKGFVHSLSLFKKQTNTTYVNNQPLAYGDSVVLSHGDVIQMPDAVLQFEVPDDEGTEFNGHMP